MWEGKNLHSHSDSAFLGISASERHPRDVQRVGESSKDLSPHYTKVFGALPVGSVFGEAAVEDVSDHVAGQTSDDGFTSEVAVMMVC